MAPFKGIPKQTVLRPKQTAFRLPQKTLDILDKIVEEGKARTRTDALILAVDASENLIFTEDAVIFGKIAEYEKRIEELEHWKVGAEILADKQKEADDEIEKLKRQREETEAFLKELPAIVKKEVIRLQAEQK